MSILKIKSVMSNREVKRAERSMEPRDEGVVIRAGGGKWFDRGRGEDNVSLGNMARMSVGATASLMKEI